MSTQSTEPPRIIDGFEIVAKIGQGAMGAVFRARQLSMHRMVALKILPPKIAKKNPKILERFMREARISAQINHTNVVQGIQFGKDEATKLYYFAMEYVDGPSVQTVLKKEKVLDEKRALNIALGIANGLLVTSEAGIVHRDIKPDNILLTKRGEAKLADLGLARRVSDWKAQEGLDAIETESGQETPLDAGLTQSGRAVGTPSYMAPEQAKGQGELVDIRTDLYALGVTLFHMVTGRLPFQGANTVVIMEKRLREKAPRACSVNSKVSAGTSALISTLMEKEREDRIQTPRELIQKIEGILEALEGKVKGGKIAPQQKAAGVAASGIPVRSLGPKGKAKGVKAPVRSPRKVRRPEPAAGSSTGLLLAGLGIPLLLVGFYVYSSGKTNALDSNISKAPPTRSANPSKLDKDGLAKDQSRRKPKKPSPDARKIPSVKALPGEVDPGHSKNKVPEKVPDELRPWDEAIARLDHAGAMVALEEWAQQKGLDVFKKTSLQIFTIEKKLCKNVRDVKAQVDSLLSVQKLNEADGLLNAANIPEQELAPSWYHAARDTLTAMKNKVSENLAAAEAERTISTPK